MLGICEACLREVTRYGSPKEMSKPCTCGHHRFWCTIFEFGEYGSYSGNRYDLVDVQTNEVIGSRSTPPMRGTNE